MRSPLSLLAPRLTPTMPRVRYRRFSRASANSWPRLLKPRRLMTAPSSARRNSRGCGLPACGRGMQRSDLDEAEAEAQHRLEHLGVLVEPGRQPDRIGKGEAGDLRFERRTPVGFRRGIRCQCAISAPRTRPMRTFRIKPKGEGADEGVEAHGLLIVTPALSRGLPVLQEQGECRIKSGMTKVRLSFAARATKSE